MNKQLVIPRESDIGENICRKLSTQVARVLVLMACAMLAAAQAPSPSQPATGPAPGVSYADGQLRIDVVDTTISEVLIKVATATGIKIDLPADANGERMPVLKLGPGPARQVLASLLRETRFNFLIQASDTDPEKLQSVVILPGEKTLDTPPAREEVAQSPYRPAHGTSPQPLPESDLSLGNRTSESRANEGVQQSSLNPPVVPGDTDPSAAATPAESGLPNGSSPATSELPSTRTSNLSPPVVLSQQKISQQLQQMYVQRMQMIQQSRQVPSPTTPTASDSN